MDKFEQYKVTAPAWWQSILIRGIDGYGVMSVSEQWEWEALAGWNDTILGDWPYVIFFAREKDGHFQIIIYAEGDVTMYAFPSREIEDAFLTEQAQFYSQAQGTSRIID